MKVAFTLRTSGRALLLCVAVLANSAWGQSLSVAKKDTNYWVNATSPQSDPHTLQGSANLHLWVDLQNPVQDQYSYQVAPVDVAQRYFRLIPPPAPGPDIRIVLLGDSMTSDCCGWGQGMYRYFKPNVTVVNYATAWTSTRVFLASEEFDKMKLIQPDYVLIQYGFMDGGTDPDRSTPLDEFAENLRTIVRTVRGFNGVPIMVTLHSEREWDAQGKVYPFWQSRNNVTKAIAAEMQTPLVDLNQLSMDLLNKLGPAGSQFMEFVPGDDMHLSALGAVYFAQLVVNALPDALGPYMTGILEPPPKP